MSITETVDHRNRLLTGGEADATDQDPERAHTPPLVKFSPPQPLRGPVPPGPLAVPGPFSFARFEVVWVGRFRRTPVMRFPWAASRVGERKVRCDPLHLGVASRQVAHSRGLQRLRGSSCYRHPQDHGQELGVTDPGIGSSNSTSVVAELKPLARIARSARAARPIPVRTRTYLVSTSVTAASPLMHAASSA